MTPLGPYLRHLIEHEGPITIARYMAEALGHPDHGYYMTREPFGAAGDFITAPEVSQMFGELLGLWMTDLWQRMDAPQRLALIELGPGRGTLMTDLLRTVAAVSGLKERLSIHLVEMSPRLCAIQRQTLRAHPGITWHTGLDGALDATRGAPLLLIANEFFDALPIHQLVRGRHGWHERLVGYDPASQRFSLTSDSRPSALAALLSPELEAAALDSVAEICPLALQAMAGIGGAITRESGAALIIDYGYLASQPGETLQAVARHKFADPFAAPGEADITAHVDFAALARVATEANPDLRLSGPVTQGRFLKNLGIEIRAERLKGRATAEKSHDITAAVERLTGSAMMGDLFKVMAVSAPDSPFPAGFE